MSSGEDFRIVVIGASAGGFEALKKIVADLPKDFRASIFIVRHISPDVRGVLPQVLNCFGTIHATNTANGEAIEPNRIYVAPPDHHLLVEKGIVRVTKGPKENRFRPAVDPLFRSAAYAYGTRVVGVILSGALDDGTAGLWTVKNRGGLAIVQDPLDAEVPSMPENARREVAVDYVVPIAEMAKLLVVLSQQEVAEAKMEDDEKTRIEIGIAAGTSGFETGVRPVLRVKDDATRGFILIIFEQTANQPDAPEAVFAEHESAIIQLEEALLQSQWQYRRSIEQSEVQAEELKASNEELQAINEELRSATEELETGKEELQSVNEELITVNQELKIKIEELSQSVNDFQNLINSTSIGTIFLDRRFRVKIFPPAALKIFNLIPADTGRSLSDITHKLAAEDLIKDVETVLQQLQPIEREVRTTDDNV